MDATTKILVKFKNQSRILGDVNSIPSGGGVPEGRRGSLTPMSEDGSLCLPLSTPNSLSEHPRDEQPILSVFEHDEQLDRASLRTTKSVACFERACPVAFTLCPAMDVSNKTAVLCGGFAFEKCVFGLLPARECCLCRLTSAFVVTL